MQVKLGVCCWVFSLITSLPVLFSEFLVYLFMQLFSSPVSLSPAHVTQKLPILQIDFQGFCCSESSEGTRAVRGLGCSCCLRLFHTTLLGELLGSHSSVPVPWAAQGQDSSALFLHLLGALVLAVRMMYPSGFRGEPGGFSSSLWALLVLIGRACPE